MDGHTPEPWTVGRTLDTPQTHRWTRAEREANDRVESRLVFSGFSAVDQGRSRVLVAECQRPDDARMIAAAPDLLTACEAFARDAEYRDGRCGYCRIDCERFDAECPARLARAAIAKANGET